MRTEETVKHRLTLTLLQNDTQAWTDERIRLAAEGRRGTLDDPFDIDLTGADLRGSDLSQVDLTDVRLVGADLRDALLSRADLARADLSQADLRGSTLIGTNFHFTTLAGTRFDGSTVGDTCFLRCDLSRCIGLDDVRHRFASVIDVHALVTTAEALRAQPWQRAEAGRFLRAAGVPVIFLEAVGLPVQDRDAADARVLPLHDFS